jgi:hypothetical protein
MALSCDVRLFRSSVSDVFPVLELMQDVLALGKELEHVGYVTEVACAGKDTNGFDFVDQYALKA